jgi:hypothetical protein
VMWAMLVQDPAQQQQKGTTCKWTVFTLNRGWVVGVALLRQTRLGMTK